jgi:hypothetical protein
MLNVRSGRQQPSCHRALHAADSRSGRPRRRP